MNNQTIIKKIVQRLVLAAHPTKVIVFGSYARNQMQVDSDIDILVVESTLQDKGREMVRLRNAIGNVGLGVDLLVYSQKEINEWGHLPGTALYQALKEGKVVYEAA